MVARRCWSFSSQSSSVSIVLKRLRLASDLVRGFIQIISLCWTTIRVKSLPGAPPRLTVGSLAGFYLQFLPFHMPSEKEHVPWPSSLATSQLYCGYTFLTVSSKPSMTSPEPIWKQKGWLRDRLTSITSPVANCLFYYLPHLCGVMYPNIVAFSRVGPAVSHPDRFDLQFAHLIITLTC